MFPAPITPLLRKRFLLRTTAFRQFAAYGMIFFAVFIVLLYRIEYSVTAAVQSETSSDLRWQLRYFDDYTDADLPQAIDTRIHRQSRQDDHYGLFAPDGRPLAGDIHTLPTGLTFGQAGQFRDETASTAMPIHTDVSRHAVRALGEYRSDGSRLVVARTLDDERRIRARLLRMLIGSASICFCGGLVISILFSLHQIRRVTRIRSITASIAEGNLDARLPLGTRDEFDMLCNLVNQMLDEIRRLMIEVKGTCDVIAHDLHTPLIRLKSRLSALSASSHATVPDPALELARQDVNTLLSRFAALLRISEIDSLQRRRTFAPVALSTLASELEALYAPLAGERQIVFVTDTEPVEPVLADRELLFEAFVNLVDNAVKFTPDGGRVQILLRHTSDGAQFIISDTGPGISPSERSAIFTRFYRGKRTTGMSNTGLGLDAGLGLGLVAAVVRLHDFALHIDDADDDQPGTVITIDCWPHDT